MPDPLRPASQPHVAPGDRRDVSLGVFAIGKDGYMAGRVIEPGEA